MHITYVSNFLGPVTCDWQWACDVVRGVTGVARPPIGRGDVTWPAARLWLAEDRGDTGGDHHLGRGMHELCWAQRDSHDTRDTLSFSSSSTVASSSQTRSSPIAAAGAGPGAPDAIDLVIGPAASLQRLIISSFTLLQPLPLFQPRRMTIQN